MVERGGRAALDWTLAELLVVGCVVLSVVDGHDTAMAYAAPVVFAFAILVFGHEAGWLSRMLRHRFLLLLGTLSYSIYMIHMFVDIRFVNIARLAGRLLDTDLLAGMGNRGEALPASTSATRFWATSSSWRFSSRRLVELSLLSFHRSARPRILSRAEQPPVRQGGRARDKKHQAVGTSALQAI